MNQRQRLLIGALATVVQAMTLALIVGGGQGVRAQRVIIYVDADAACHR